MSMLNFELLKPGSIQIGDVLNVDLYTSNGVLLVAAGRRVTKEIETRLLSQDIYVRSSVAWKLQTKQKKPKGGASESRSEVKTKTKSKSEHKSETGFAAGPAAFRFTKRTVKIKTIDKAEDVKKVLELSDKREKVQKEEREKQLHAFPNTLYQEMADIYSEIYCSGLSQTHERLRVEKVANQVVIELLTKGRWFFDFNALRTEDNYTTIHSVNVALISALMGHDLGYKSEFLLELIFAAFLHDLGRRRVPLMIINKPGKLTPQEFEYVKKHVDPQFMDFSDRIPSSVKEVIHQHHERWDGSGYPNGLAQNSIHPFAQIIAVADVFDALTSDRPYRKALSLNDAFEWVVAGAGTLFNPDMVRVFEEVITLYPSGAVVKLSTGETGRVMKISRGHPNKPQVRLIFDSGGQFIQDYVVKDLMENRTVFVKSVKYPTD
jgi:HD-GYP domain-containing protein (c-di-GMP phosphodiesterase class II)